MTPDGTRPPILLIRSEANLCAPVELHLLEADGSTRLIERRESLGPTENLDKIVQEIVTAGTLFQDIVVDLGSVLWLNSTGLGALVGLIRQRKQLGETVALVGANERIAKLLKVTSLDLAMPSYETLAGAARSLRAEGPETAS
jgi:anti-sigma B factor antagonist